MILGDGKQIKINGKFIGILDNRIFTAERELKRKFRLYDGWGLSKELIRELIEVWTELIVFKIKDSGQLVYILQVTPQNWLSKGIIYFNPKLKEEQYVLPEPLFDKKIMVNQKR